MTEESPLEAIGLGEPGVSDTLSESKQVRHFGGDDFHETDVAILVFTAPTSNKGVSIPVYDKCIKGVCSCTHVIGENRSQLKPCRFAALLFQSGRIPTDDELVMYNGIVDGFKLVST